MFYLEILEELFKNKIRYLLVGGLAVNLYGIPRITQDIDLVIQMDENNIYKAIDFLKNLGYLPRLPVKPESLADKTIRDSWINEKNMIAFSFYNKDNNYKVVDIIISHNLDFEKSYINRQILEANDFEISLASIDDIISMKEISSREQDKADIEMLRKLREING